MYVYFPGLALKAFVALTETPLYPPIRNKLLRDNGYPQALDEQSLDEEPLFVPEMDNWATTDDPRWNNSIISQDEEAVTASADVAAALGLDVFGSSDSQACVCKVMEFHAAYLEKRTTPAATAEHIIKALEESDTIHPPMRFLIAHDAALLRGQADASTARFAMGNPLSIFDGVPFAVKDEFDVEGFPTTAGTAFLGSVRTIEGTLPAAQALLDAGALLVGKANMHEIGLGTTGLNTTHGTPRNPHDTSRHTGGSSSGSSAIVAAGLCVFAIGADGGGSIRIPSALCGCVGLKPTHGRVCPFPGPQMTFTVGVVGPLAQSVADCAMLYALMANRGHAQYGLPAPPPLQLPDLSIKTLQAPRPLHGITIGVHWEWFNHAKDVVVTACRQALNVLEASGAVIVSVQVPFLKEVSIAHSATIAPEMRSAISAYYANGCLRRKLSAETRISLATAGSFTASTYISAQKIRRKADKAMRAMFASQCDILATPTVPIIAPPIRPRSLGEGASDLGTTITLMRFAQLANFVGIPAISVPVSSAPVETGSSTLLPIGLQLMAAPWQESVLLYAGAVLETRLLGDFAQSNGLDGYLRLPLANESVKMPRKT